MSTEADSKAKELKDQSLYWFRYAGEAYQQKNNDLSKKCLQRWFHYQNELATFEGTVPPEEPKEPEEYFGKYYSGRGDGGTPDQPALVPRKPQPNAGAGEIALPIPMESNEEET